MSNSGFTNAADGSTADAYLCNNVVDPQGFTCTAPVVINTVANDTKQGHDQFADAVMYGLYNDTTS